MKTDMRFPGDLTLREWIDYWNPEKSTWKEDELDMSREALEEIHAIRRFVISVRDEESEAETDRDNWKSLAERLADAIEKCGKSDNVVACDRLFFYVEEAIADIRAAGKGVEG